MFFFLFIYISSPQIKKIKEKDMLLNDDVDGYWPREMPRRQQPTPNQEL